MSGTLSRAVLASTDGQGDSESDQNVSLERVVAASDHEETGQGVAATSTAAKVTLLALVGALVQEYKALLPQCASSDDSRVLAALSILHLDDPPLDAASIHKQVVGALQSWKPPPPVDELYSKYINPLNLSVCSIGAKKKGQGQRPTIYTKPDPVSGAAEASKVLNTFVGELVPKGFHGSRRGAFEFTLSILKLCDDGAVVTFESPGLQGFHQLAQTAELIGATRALVDHRKRVAAMQAMHPVRFSDLGKHDQCAVMNLILDVLIPDRSKQRQYDVSKSQNEECFRKAHPWWPPHDTVPFGPVSNLNQTRRQALYDAISNEGARVWSSVMERFHEVKLRFTDQVKVLRLLHGVELPRPFPPATGNPRPDVGVPGGSAAINIPRVPVQPDGEDAMAGADPTFRLPAGFALKKVFEEAEVDWPAGDVWVCGGKEIDIVKAFDYIHSHGGLKEFVKSAGTSAALRINLVGTLGGDVEPHLRLSAANDLKVCLNSAAAAFTRMDEIFTQQRRAIAQGTALPLSQYISHEQGMAQVLQIVQRPDSHQLPTHSSSSAPAETEAPAVPGDRAAVPASDAGQSHVGEVAVPSVDVMVVRENILQGAFASSQPVAIACNGAAAGPSSSSRAQLGASAASESAGLVSLQVLQEAFEKGGLVPSEAKRKANSSVTFSGSKTSLLALCNAILCAGGFKKLFPKDYGAGGKVDAKGQQGRSHVAQALGLAKQLPPKVVTTHFTSAAVNFIHAHLEVQGVFISDPLQQQVKKSSRVLARQSAVQSGEGMSSQEVLGDNTTSSQPAEMAGKRAGTTLSPLKPPQKKFAPGDHGAPADPSHQSARASHDQRGFAALQRGPLTMVDENALDALVLEKKRQSDRYKCAKWLCFDDEVGCGVNDLDHKKRAQQNCWKCMGGTPLPLPRDDEPEPELKGFFATFAPIGIEDAIAGLRNAVDEDLLGLGLSKEIAHEHIKFFIENTQVFADYVKCLTNYQAFSAAWDKMAASMA